MWQEVLDFIFTTLKNITDFWYWLSTPIEIGAFKAPPLAMLGIGGFIIIIGLWIFKLVNPLS